MTSHKRRIIQLLVRFQNASEAAEERADEAYSYDREFDGGEFSGPAINRALEREQDRIAQRFGLISATLAEDLVSHFRCWQSQAIHLHCPFSHAPLPD